MPPIQPPQPPPIPAEVIDLRETVSVEASRASAELLAPVSGDPSITPATELSTTIDTMQSLPDDNFPDAGMAEFQEFPISPAPPSSSFPLPDGDTEATTTVSSLLPVEQATAKAIVVTPPPDRAVFPVIGDELPSAKHLRLPAAKRLITQTRDGESQEFLITPDDSSNGNNTDADDTPQDEATEETIEILDPFGNQIADPARLVPPELIELISDRQEYDAEQQVVTATGNVTMRFANGLLLADRLRVNLTDRFAVAEGNVTLKRGEQILQGQRFEYFFVLDKGVIYDANGEIYQPSTARDFSPTLPNDPANAVLPNQTLNDRLAVNQPVQNIVGREGFQTSVGAGLNPGGANPTNPAGNAGTINRIRFQAEQIDFDADGWTAKKVRLTNDPFSPPELEVQAETADFYNVSPEVDELKLTGSRVLLDQRVSLPFQDRLTIDRRDRQPGILSIGYDGRDRGGLYLQANFTPIDTDSVRFQIKPQYLLQKVAFPGAFDDFEDSFSSTLPAADQESEICALCPAAFGLITELDAQFNERTSLINTFNFSNLDLERLDNSLRARLAVQNKLGPLENPHDLRVEYNYRERLFNGSLGFQTVNSSLGAVLVSPVINFGDPFTTLTYQASIQNVEAATDDLDLINSSSSNNLTTLMRYQGAASLSRLFMLWTGDQLPSTATEGLKYTPLPVVPYVAISTGLTGVGGFYSNGSTQPSLTGSVVLQGQVGHFSRPYLDYTGFNIGFSQGIRGDQSPFFFDRFADTQVVLMGITQQVYGPLRIGAQSAYSITVSREISTDYFIEYSRRTHNIQIRYNPVLEVGSINLRISDFNWSGNPGTFDGTDINPVIQGVIR